MKDNNGKPIYFDGIDNSAYVTGKAKHSARDGWIYIDGENFSGVRADVGARPGDARRKDRVEDALLFERHLAGPDAEHRCHPSIYNLTMDPYEKYDMTFNGAVATRNPTSSPGRYAGMDNGWALSLMDIPLTEFNKSIVKYPNIEALPGRSLERHDPESAEPEKSIALRSDQAAEDRRSRRRLT